MHLLSRGSPPACLSRYQHGRDNWDTLHKNRDHVAELRKALREVCASQCAYCERRAGEDWHIEHLRPKSRFPKHTFSWHNLFSSCNNKYSCGLFKDNHKACGPYDPDDLIAPDVEDPDQLLIFGQDGVVHSRAGLSRRDDRRAQETIRVFNLNSPDLVRSRFNLVNMLLSGDAEVVEILAEIPPEERSVWVAELISDYCSDGFQTTVRHLLSA